MAKSVLVAQFLNKRRNYAPVRRKKSYAKQYIRYCIQFLRFVEFSFGVKQLHRINQDHYAAYIEHLLNKRKLSRSTVNRKIKHALKLLSESFNLNFVAKTRR